MDTQYNTETGTVKRVEKGKAFVRIDRAAQKSCGGCCACASAGSGEFELRVPDNGYHAGQKLTLRIPVTSKYLSLLLLFVVPMVAFAAGAILGANLKLEGIDESAGAVLGAFGGFAVAFVIAFLANSYLASRHPILVEPAEPEAAEEPETVKHAE